MLTSAINIYKYIYIFFKIANNVAQKLARTSLSFAIIQNFDHISSCMLYILNANEITL